MQPVVIEAALNGATPKTRNPTVPTSPPELVADARACLAAGAAIVHTHTDDPTLTGDAAARRYRDAWDSILREHPDTILYPTVALGTSVEERFAHLEPLTTAGVLRMGLLDPGSVNLGMAGDDGLPGPVEFPYVTTFADIRWLVATHERLALAPSISIFEPGFLRATLAYHRAGRLPRGAFVKLYFGDERGYFAGPPGATFGLPPTRTALDAYLELLAGTGLPWAVAVIGGDVVASGMARLALEHGGHVRVGLEDHAGERQPTNAELVREVAALAREIGRPVASPVEAGRLLGLPRLSP
jgi:uncharacterized protein (DUF849 family)